MEYWTKSQGTGGRVVTEDDFVVNELPAKKFLVKFERKDGKISAVAGPYFLYRLEKRCMTTKAALDFICRKFGLREVGYAGLKDKHAVTSQYITTKQKIDGFESDKISLRFISPCKNMMQVGELEGNSFRITLHGCKNAENAKKTIDELRKGTPNYFGPQRFGLNNNEEIGRFILQKNYDSALEKIDSKNITSIRQLDKKTIKFYIHAYQSFVFNAVLDTYIRRNSKASFKDIPIFGFDTKLKKDFFGKETKRMLKSDGITDKDFQIRDLAITCRGGMRAAFVEIKNISCEIKEDNQTEVAKQFPTLVVLNFDLPKGSYATVVIREITK